MLQSFLQKIGFAVTLLLLPVLSYAQGTLYKWTDSRGNVHYSNTPTNTTATAVDNTLPPASSFKSPTPPPEATTAPSSSSEGKTTSGGEGEATPEEATGDSSTPTTMVDGSQAPPEGATTESEPAPTPTDGSATDAQQEGDGKPQLTPEQEQALKDSPM
jgi:hypothetical protein